MIIGCVGVWCIDFFFISHLTMVNAIIHHFYVYCYVYLNEQLWCVAN